jgi:hypothetical protein
VPRDKGMVALQNPKQFSGRLSFISLFIFVKGDRQGGGEGERRGTDAGSKNGTACRDAADTQRPSRSLSFFFVLFFFLSPRIALSSRVQFFNP